MDFQYCYNGLMMDLIRTCLYVRIKEFREKILKAKMYK